MTVNKQLSQLAMKIVRQMIRELSGVKYCYRDMIEGCYDTIVNHYEGFSEAKEGKEEIVDYVIKFFNEYFR